MRTTIFLAALVAAVAAQTTTKPVATAAPTTKPVSLPATTIKATVPTTTARRFNVSVVGDATYNIPGPICSGNGVVPAGSNCPVKGDKAVFQCFPHLKTFSNGTCTAGVNAVCRKIPSGAWGCVWNVTAPTGVITAPVPTTAKPTTAAPKPTTAAPTTAKPTTTAAVVKAATAAPTTRPSNATTAKPATPTTTPRWFNVSVVGDATYYIAGPICSGGGLVPAGTKCPAKSDKAVASCHKGLKSFVNNTCVAPVDAVCQKIPSGAWGCVWSTATAKPTTAAPTTTKATTVAVTTKKP